MKKFLLFLAVALICFFVPQFAFCQDTTAVVDPVAPSFVPAAIWHALMFIVALYELVIRYYPTVKSYSIITFLGRVFSFLVPDKAKGGETH